MNKSVLYDLSLEQKFYLIIQEKNITTFTPPDVSLSHRGKNVKPQNFLQYLPPCDFI